MEADLSAPSGGERATRHRLTRDQQAQIAQQYADGATSAANLARQFGTSEVSVYRTLRKQGVSLRGRSSSKAADTHEKRAADVPSMGRVAPNSTSSAKRSRATDGTTTTTNGTTRTQFAIRFRAEQIVYAATIRDVLGQLQSVGAADILEIIREE